MQTSDGTPVATAGCFSVIVLTFVIAFVATLGVRLALHILGL